MLRVSYRPLPPPKSSGFIAYDESHRPQLAYVSGSSKDFPYSGCSDLSANDFSVAELQRIGLVVINPLATARIRQETTARNNDDFDSISMIFVSI